MDEYSIIVTEVNDPKEVSEVLARHERAERNMDWLEAHWQDLMPQARGKFVAVAGQEAFIGDSFQEASQWAKRVHPDDDGAWVQYVRKEKGPRIYAYRRQLAVV